MATAHSSLQGSTLLASTKWKTIVHQMEDDRPSIGGRSSSIMVDADKPWVFGKKVLVYNEKSEGKCEKMRIYRDRGIAAIDKAPYLCSRNQTISLEGETCENRNQNIKTPYYYE